MKKCLLIGCSNGLNLHHDFSELFGTKDIEWINLSVEGMGNRYITSRLFEYIDDVGIPDYVYLQYSGLSRIDLPLDYNVTIPDYSYQIKTKKRTWVASGGRNGSWMSCDLLKKFFAYMYNIKKVESHYDLNMHEIFKAIELCKTLKIKYNWTSYYDYTNPPNDKVKIDGYVKSLPTYLDISNHISDFPLNLAYELNDIPEDSVHYSRYVSEKFFKKNKKKFNI